MDISKRELIFGNDKDREDTVKLIILSIILNGATTRSEENDKEEFINPLIDLRITPKDHEVLYNDLKRNNPADKANIDALELIERNLKSFREISEYFEEFLEASFKSFDTIEEESKEWFEINYPFYTNVRNFKGYQYLVNKDDIELEYHSNLFNKLLLGNNRFAQLFMEGLSNKSHNQRTVPNMICKRDKMNIDDFIRNVGQFGALSVDFKNAGYTVFIKAFTEMWARNSTIFMAYFNEKLFNIEWNTRNFKKLNDTFLHGIITAEELSKILYDLIEMEKYSIETMRGHITFELYIQKIIIINEVELEEVLNNDLYKYVTNMIEAHNRYMKK